jgi:hypothetical protein
LITGSALIRCSVFSSRRLEAAEHGGIAFVDVANAWGAPLMSSPIVKQVM